MNIYFLSAVVSLQSQHSFLPQEHNRSSLKELLWQTMTHKHTFCLEQDTNSASSTSVAPYDGLTAATALLEESVTPVLISPPSLFRKQNPCAWHSLTGPNDAAGSV